MPKNLTKYEVAKILGIRATQIASGSAPMVDITGLDDAYKIAELELERKKIPFLIVRKYPGGKTKEINPNECVR